MMNRSRLVIAALVLVACKKTDAEADAGTAATTASTAAPSTASIATASASVTAAIPILAPSATATASAPTVHCEKPAFTLVQGGKTSCLSPCGADSDCKHGEKCHELGDKLDPKGLYGAMFCFPPAMGAVSTTSAKAKCAAGEALIQARYDEMCIKTCHAEADCGKSGPCQDANDTDGKAIKVCSATGHLPGQKP
jgi:hypothetical protein